MRFVTFLLASLVTANVAQADIAEIPLLPDGSVDLEKIFHGFELAFPIYANGTQATRFEGEMLGGQFSGHVIEGDTAHEYTLVLEAPKHSEHGHFLIAILATEVVCLRRGYAPGKLRWQETKFHDGTTWKVSTSCATPSH